jgi:predicted PurR-regulated permease PerM
MTGNNGNPESTWLMSPGRSRAVFLFLLAIGITLLFLKLIDTFLIALLMAAVLSALMYPLFTRLVDLFKGRRSLASATTVLLGLTCVIVPASLILAITMSEALEVSETASKWLKNHDAGSVQLQQKIEEIPALNSLIPYQDEILEKASEIAGKAGAFVGKSIVSGAVGTAEFFLLLFIMLYAMFYFFLEGPGMLRGALKYTPLLESDKTKLMNTFVSVSRATLKGTLVIGIIQGGLAGASFAVAGIEGAVFWGVVMMVLSIIPGIGTGLIWVPAVIYLALTGQTVEAVGVGVWCALVVGTVDNILRPMLVGRDTEMPDLLVLLTTLGGLIVFGAAGMVLGPIIGALFTAIWQLWSSALTEERNDAATDQMPVSGESSV